jgi:lysophospholipase L1-like esterase
LGAAGALSLLGMTSCGPASYYVALGDSFTAGPVIPVQQNDPGGCLRSDHNYPHLFAPNSGHPGFRDVSCSGAETEDMTQAQQVDPGPNPPQFNVLNSRTRLVTLGIGGNDIGFSEIAQNCAAPLPPGPPPAPPQGTPCQDHYVTAAGDELQRRIAETAPKVAAVLQGIHSRSPQARILVIGYPALLPESGPGCWPTMPIAEGDVPYLRDMEKDLNAMLQAQALANGAEYVDTYTPSIGHDACALPTVRWVEPVVPAAPAAPIHPNALGMEQIAAIVLQAL